MSKPSRNVPSTSCGFALTAPLGCDTFVAYPPLAPEGSVIFGKNSDRPKGEGQSITRYPAKKWNKDDERVLSCTYINIPQVEETRAVLLSQIDWMYGAEMGANDCGVVIGNEAVWTVEPMSEDEESGSKGRALLGMDLVRLGLERGRSARESLDVITALLGTHGQGGPCAENDPSFTYHNSFLIADLSEAWVLETAGRHWVAERVTRGGRNISNGLTIRTEFDLSSDGLEKHARDCGLWSGEGRLDWAGCFSDGPADHSPCSRQCRGEALLTERAVGGMMDVDAMKGILRDHESGICMHGGFETTASMVSELRNDGRHVHWLTGKPHPCKSEFRIYEMPTKKEE